MILMYMMTAHATLFGSLNRHAWMALAIRVTLESAAMSLTLLHALVIVLIARPSK